MTQEFDKLIADAAPPVPDSGPSRRMSRAMLHERMRRDNLRRRARDLRGMSLAAGLAFLVVIGGVTDLGSDGFDFELSTLDLGNGETVPAIESKVRGHVGTALPGMNEDDVRELQQQTFLREGVIQNILGYELNGGVPSWTVTYLTDVNGRSVYHSREPKNLSVANQVAPQSMIPFMAEHIGAFQALVDSGQLEAKPYGIVTADGLSFAVQQWSREYPGWGVFTYYRGLPVDR